MVLILNPVSCRTVRAEDKSFAVGVQYMLFRVLGKSCSVSHMGVILTTDNGEDFGFLFCFNIFTKVKGQPRRILWIILANTW